MKLMLNLASRTYLNRRALYGFYAVVGGLLVLLLAIGVGLLISSQSQVRQIREHLAELGREAAGKENAEGKTFTPAAYEKLLADIRFANEILAQDSFRWTALLNRLEEVVPERVAVSGIVPDYKEKSLKLTGLARGVEDLQQFLDSLIASAYFSDVYLLQQSRLKDSGPIEAAGVISFSIVVRGAF
jgi:type IV pilus assembly protein PilN